MSRSDFKNQVDNLMNILFGGGVANHSTIIEQINYLVFLRALSKKDDSAIRLDSDAERIFGGDLSKYHWDNLLMLNAESLFTTLEEIFRRLPELTTDFTIKQLFRDAHVKVFDKPTLRRLVHEIEKMMAELEREAATGHTDIYGDMYEYLLGKLSQAGTLGSFRTPRHIIKFIVDIINPAKGETILDPACGTAGFLVAALKHLEDKYTSEEFKKLNKPALDLLNHKERKFLSNNTFTGFDSDSEMFKFGLMNLYLHHLEHPNIKRQNTLVDTAGDRTKWDVILANPPFAGAIDKDSIAEELQMGTRSTEILFLKYMIDHLSANGRAGVIVPEGVIFASSNAHKKIRQLLIEEAGLWCVVSLPAGIFNPYAGVKTSILFFDKTLKDKNNYILFTKIQNDGFDLGAKKTPITINDLPVATEFIKQYQKHYMAGDNIDVIKTLVNLNGLASTGRFEVKEVEKQKILESTDLGLVPERYQAGTTISSKWPAMKIADLCVLQRGFSYSTKELGAEGDGIPFYNLKSIKRESGAQSSDFKYFCGSIQEKHYVSKNDLLIALTDLTPTSELIGSPKLVDNIAKAGYSADLAKIVFKTGDLLPEYLYYILRSNFYRDYIKAFSNGANVKHLQVEGFYKFEISLPPLEIQKQIVAELDGNQKIIDGAKQVVENWKPRIDIDPEWKKVKLGEVCKIGSSKRVFESEWKTEGVPFYRAREIVKLAKDGFVDNELFISEKMFADYSKKYGCTSEGDLMVTEVGTLGICYRVKKNDRFYFKDGNIICLQNFFNNVDSNFIEQLFATDLIKDQITAGAAGGTVGTYTITNAKNTVVPLPPLEIQKQIVEKIEAERQLVESNKKLLIMYEQKVKDRISEICGGL